MIQILFKLGKRLNVFDLPLFQKDPISPQEVQEKLAEDKRSFFIFKPCKRCDRSCQAPADCADMTHAWNELQRWASIQDQQKKGGGKHLNN
jgi:hypothetical protein